MSLKLDGKNPLSYMGVTPDQPPQQRLEKRRPTSNDFQGIEVGTLWTIPAQSTSPSEEVWMLMGKAGNVAIWSQLNSSGGSTYPNHELLVGTGTAVINTIASGSAGQSLISNGAGSDPGFNNLTVAGGGTGETGFTAYTPVCGGTTMTDSLQSVAATGTLGQVLTSNGAGALPSFEDVTFGSTVTVAQGGTGDTSMAAFEVVCGGVTNVDPLQTVGSVGTTGQVLTSNGAGALPSFETLSVGVAEGGTGDASFTVFTPVCGGTTTTGALQSVASIGTAGQVLTSQGAGALPIFADSSVTTTVTVPYGGTGDTTVAAYQVVCGGTTNTNPLQTVGALGNTGQVLTSNGAASLPSWQTNSASGGVLVTSYLASGSGNHVLNAATQMVQLFMWSAGGNGLPGTTGTGGASGVGGSFEMYWCPASFFGGGGSSVAYTVGAPASRLGNSTGFGNVFTYKQTYYPGTGLFPVSGSNLSGGNSMGPGGSAAPGGGGVGGSNGSAGAAGYPVYYGDYFNHVAIVGGTYGGGAGNDGSTISGVMFGGSGGGGGTYPMGHGGNGGKPGGGGGGGGGSVSGAGGAGGTGAPGALYVVEYFG